MNTFYIDNNVIFEGVFDMHECVSRLVESNAIIYISVDVELSTDTTLGTNSILVFQNGAKLLANTPVTLTGNNTSIEAPMATVFGANIQLGGSFLNAEWPVEWWGAISDYDADMSGIINRALQEISNTDKQGTLLLMGRYEVRDTIYMQPGVAISGATHTFSRLESTYFNYQYHSNRGTLVVNFTPDDGHNYANKWIIDTRYKYDLRYTEEVNGQTVQQVEHMDEPIPVNLLYQADEDKLLSNYMGCNISFLHIEDKDMRNAQYIFGAIRLNSLQYGMIENVSIKASVFMGLALVGKVWTTTLKNLYLYAFGCPLYLGRACTTLTAHNVTIHSEDSSSTSLPFALKKAAGVGNENLIEPVLQERTLPPYWDPATMKSCGIIMEKNSHCTFIGCTIEKIDAVICGTDYNAKFISPYIEKTHYTFGWLFASTDYSMPNSRYELIIEDMLHGYETFPAMDKHTNGAYKYLSFVDMPDYEPGITQGYFHYLPTFGTVRGVIKAHNVSRATCWIYEDNIYEQDKDGNWHLVTWTHPSYFIYVTPGIKQRSFYYDKYKLIKRTNQNTGESQTLLDPDSLMYCKHKKIIVEGTSGEPVRYYFDESNDSIDPNQKTTDDNKAEWDTSKRQLLLGTSLYSVTQSSELFARDLNGFIMSPVYFNSLIDYEGVVIRKKFTIEIINGARNISFGKQLKLHDCEVTFKNSHTANAIFNRSGQHDLLGISGDCTLNFEGPFLIWIGLEDDFIGLLGNVHVNLTINLLCTTFPGPETYIDGQGVTHDYAQTNLNTMFNSNAFLSRLSSFSHGCTLVINKLQSDGTIVRTIQEFIPPAPES